MFVTSAFFLAAWDPITPLFTSALAGVTNLILDLFLVNVMHKGIAGAAIATVFSQVPLEISKLVNAIWIVLSVHTCLKSQQTADFWRHIWVMLVRWTISFERRQDHLLSLVRLAD